MKKIISILLALIFTGLATAAMADPGSPRGPRDGYASQGNLTERHLDNQGDRIQQRFNQKAVRAADQGRFRQARNFEQQGRQVNRHLDRKAAVMHERFEHRGDYRHEGHPHHPYPPAGHSGRGHDFKGDYVSLTIQQPGFLFGWQMYN